MPSPPGKKKRVHASTSEHLDDVRRGQQAIEEIFASKPEGYDASRNGETALKQLDCHRQCSELLRDGKKMDAGMIAQLEGALQDMADNSPAAKEILDGIETEACLTEFTGESDRMRWKMLRMRERMVPNQQVADEARARWGSDGFDKISGGSKLLEDQVVGDCAHAFKSDPSDDDVARALGEKFSFNDERVTSRDIVCAPDGREYHSFNGALFGDEETVSYRLVANDPATGKQYPFEICVPDYLLPPSEWSAQRRERAEVMAELERQHENDRKKKVNHKFRFQEALKERVGLIIAKVLGLQRKPTGVECDDFEKLADQMIKAGVPSIEVCKARRDLHTFNESTPIERDPIGRNATEAAQEFVDQEPDAETRAKMQADIDAGRVRLVKMPVPSPPPPPPPPDASGQSAMASKLAGLWDNAKAEGTSGMPADFKEAMDKMPEAQKASFMKVIDEVTNAGPDGKVTDDMMERMKQVAAGISGLPSELAATFPITPELTAECKTNVNKAIGRLADGEKIDDVAPPTDGVSDHQIMMRFAETVRIGAYAYHEDCMEVICAFDNLCKVGGKDGNLFQVLRRKVNGGCLDKFGGMPIVGVTTVTEDTARFKYRAEGMAVAYEQAMIEKAKAERESDKGVSIGRVETDPHLPMITEIVKRIKVGGKSTKLSHTEVDAFMHGVTDIAHDRKSSMSGLFTSILKEVERKNPRVWRKAMKGRATFRVDLVILISECISVAMHDVEQKAVHCSTAKDAKDRESKPACKHPMIERINGWLREHPQYRVDFDRVSKELAAAAPKDSGMPISEVVTRVAEGMPEDLALSLFQACGGDLIDRNGPIPNQFKDAVTFKDVSVTKPSGTAGASRGDLNPGIPPAALLASMPKGGGVFTVFNSSGEHQYDFRGADDWDPDVRMAAASEVSAEIAASHHDLSDEQMTKKAAAEEFVKNASASDMQHLIDKAGLKMKLVPDPSYGTVAEYEEMHRAEHLDPTSTVDHFERLGLSKDRPIISRNPDGSKVVIPHPLTEGEKARMVLAEQQGSIAWKQAVDAIKGARDGEYPPDWHEQIIQKGLWKKIGSKTSSPPATETKFKGLRRGFLGKGKDKAAPPPPKPMRSHIEDDDSDETLSPDEDEHLSKRTVYCNDLQQQCMDALRSNPTAKHIEPLMITQNPDGSYSSGPPKNMRGAQVTQIDQGGIRTVTACSKCGIPGCNCDATTAAVRTRFVDNGIHPGWAEHLPPVENMVDEHGTTWPDWMSYVPEKYHALVGVDDRKLRDVALKHVPKEHPFHTKWSKPTLGETAIRDSKKDRFLHGKLPWQVALRAMGNHTLSVVDGCISNKYMKPESFCKMRFAGLFEVGFEPITKDGRSSYLAGDDMEFFKPDAVRCIHVKDLVISLDYDKYDPVVPTCREFIEACILHGAGIEDTRIERAKKMEENTIKAQMERARESELARLKLEEEEREREAQRLYRDSNVYKAEQHARNQKSKAKEKDNKAKRLAELDSLAKEREVQAAAVKLEAKQAQADECIDNGIKYGQQLWDEGDRVAARKRLGVANTKHFANASPEGQARSKAKKAAWDATVASERPTPPREPTLQEQLAIIADDTPDVTPGPSPPTAEPRESPSQRKARKKREKKFRAVYLKFRLEYGLLNYIVRFRARRDAARLVRERAEKEEREAREHAERQRQIVEQQAILDEIQSRDSTERTNRAIQRGAAVQAERVAGKGKGRGGRGVGEGRGGSTRDPRNAIRLVPVRTVNVNGGNAGIVYTNKPPKPAPAAAAGPSTPPPPAADDDSCIICMDRVRTHTTVPCGHLKFCGMCAAKMTKEGRQKCPECNVTLNPAQKFMKVFG